MIRKAVIPTAGLGTRFLPVTKSMPKEMLPIIDKPIIQFAVEEAIISGIEDIIIITGRGKRAIETSLGMGNEIQLTDAIRKLSLKKKALPKKNYTSYTKKKDVYAYKFKGKRYDAGDKLGYVKAIIDFALEREDLKDEVMRYLEGLA